VKILRLRTQNFRNLPDREWEFHPDFQVIYGPNEAGKSSLLEALLVGLYGDAASTDSRFMRDRRWKSSEHISVALDLKMNGDILTIERDFENRKNRLTIGDKKLTSKDKISSLLQERLPIQSESAFLQTACVRQSEVRSDIRSSDLRNQIERHALSATGHDLKALYEALANEVNELRRGWQTSAPKNPGPIKRLEDDILRLQAELADLDRKDETSAIALDEYESLNDVVTQMDREYDQEEERLRLDEKYLEAERIYQGRKKEILELQAKVERIKQIPTAIQRMAEEQAEVQKQLVDLTSRQRKALAWKQASVNLQQVESALTSLASDIAALQECRAELGRLRNPLEGTTLTRQDFLQFQALKQQTEQLQQEIGRDSAEVAQLKTAIAEASTRIDDTSKEHIECDTRVSTIEVERKLATRREELIADLAKATESESKIASQLHRIRSLEDKRTEIGTSLSSLEVLGRIDMDAFQRVLSAIPTLEEALQNEGIGLEFQPEGSVPMTMQIDNRDDQTLEVDQPLNLAAIKEIRIHIPGIGRLRLTNQSRVTRQLDARRDEVAKILAEMSVATEAEALDSFRTRNALLSQRDINAAELRAAVEGKTVADWEKEGQEVRAERERLNRELTNIPAGTTLSVIDAELARERERLSHLKTVITESQTQFSVLSQQLQTTEVRAKRRSDDLGIIEANRSAILHAAGQETEAGLRKLQDDLLAYQAHVTEVEGKRGKMLQGRLEQDVVFTHAEEQRKREEINVALADLSPSALDDSALAKVSLDIQHVEALLRVKSDETIRLVRERELLEAERPEDKHAESVVQAAIADQNRKSYERYAFPNPNERLAHSSHLQSKRAALAKKKEHRAELKVKAEYFGANRDRTATLRESLAHAKTHLHRLKYQFEVDSIVLDYMGKARDKALADLLAAIPAQVALTLDKITNGKYTRVTGTGFDLQTWSEQKDGSLEIHEMSTGTLDQFYLALRLEALRVTFPKDLPPFILDDVLVSSDPKRRSALIKVVEEYASQGQVLYLTCHDWPELAQFHQLSL